MPSMDLMGCKAVLARCLLVFVVISGVQNPAFAATDEERAAARSLAKQGAQSFGEKRYTDSVDYFSRAESLVHSPVHLIYLARAQVKLGQLVKAQEAYIKITREQLASGAPAAFRDAKEDAQRELQELEPRLGRLIVTVDNPAGTPVELTVDDAPVSAVLLGVAMPMDPGSHEVRASAEGASTDTKKVTLAEGQSESVSLKLVALPKPEEDQAAAGATTGETQAVSTVESPSGGDKGDSALLYTGYGLIGVGAIGLGVGTYFFLEYAGKKSDGDSLFQSCNPDQSCTPLDEANILQLDSERDDFFRKGVVTASVGGALAIAGAVLVVVASSGDDEVASEPRVTPWIGFNSAGVSGTF